MGQHEARWGSFAHTLSLFSPVVDSEVLPAAPWQELARGAGRNMELIIGHNSDA
jgi:para-nitrobenzyl esterase